ncbi:hypothetical protein PB2503_07819 [Parvularcula bermudensis HTCC2503]|uniref:Flagellar motor switch protein FliN-like C-terminal domain-containing protein n=1 Tax=Parvularcula bermudensis (strain ATCC BAA-594 / HTCC2503 / KCTC 12087) TaxID=314260 RepID=E0TGK0_PARBH|nr:FliM/FliN family flagellar motor C-terminal domain-containing protein [Parvularcula bermudensis]ADM09619.1 hypothetical protein PB2503_07819 [Parvularcula bermudensis HTCC2503]
MPSPGLTRHLSAPLRMPQFLAPAQQLAEEALVDLCQLVGEFLDTKVKPESCELSRVAPSYPDEGVCLDGMSFGKPMIRLVVPRDCASAICGAIFQGSVSEPAIERSIMRSLADKMSPVFGVMGSGGSFVWQEADPEIFTNRPVLRAAMKMITLDGTELSWHLDMTREFTDGAFRPSASLCLSHLSQFAFTAEALVAKPRLSITSILALKAGDKLQLPGAKLEAVTVAVPTAKSALSLAKGELGTIEQRRSLRLTEILDPGEGADIGTPSMGNGGFALADAHDAPAVESEAEESGETDEDDFSIPMNIAL